MENKYAEIIIKLEESYSSKEYYCTERYRTIGYGRKLSNVKNDPLQNTVVNEKDELLFLRTRIKDAEFQISKFKPNAWSKCNDQRKAVLISMVYQLGMAGVSKFNNMWNALERGDFELASKEMLDSLWAKQTKNRALRHAKTMKDGSLDMYYVSKGTLQ